MGMMVQLSTVVLKLDECKGKIRQKLRRIRHHHFHRNVAARRQTLSSKQTITIGKQDGICDSSPRSPDCSARLTTTQPSPPTTAASASKANPKAAAAALRARPADVGILWPCRVGNRDGACVMVKVARWNELVAPLITGSLKKPPPPARWGPRKEPSVCLAVANRHRHTWQLMRWPGSLYCHVLRLFFWEACERFFIVEDANEDEGEWEEEEQEGEAGESDDRSLLRLHQCREGQRQVPRGPRNHSDHRTAPYTTSPTGSARQSQPGGPGRQPSQSSRQGRRSGQNRVASRQSPKEARSTYGCLACPFYKLDPVKHLDCLFRNRLTTTNYVKQHLYRKHLGVYCGVCKEPFGTQEERDGHMRRRICAPKDSPIPVVSLETFAALQGIPRTLSNSERWYRIWDELFMPVARPESPYLDDEGVEFLRILRAILLDPSPHARLEDLARNSQGVMDRLGLGHETLGETLRILFTVLEERWRASREAALGRPMAARPQPPPVQPPPAQLPQLSGPTEPVVTTTPLEPGMPPYTVTALNSPFDPTAIFQHQVDGNILPQPQNHTPEVLHQLLQDEQGLHNLYVGTGLPSMMYGAQLPTMGTDEPTPTFNSLQPGSSEAQFWPYQNVQGEPFSNLDGLYLDELDEQDGGGQPGGGVDEEDPDLD
jgi:hypothetical protein